MTLLLPLESDLTLTSSQHLLQARSNRGLRQASTRAPRENPERELLTPMGDSP